MSENSEKIYTLKEREENLKEAIRNGGFIGDNGTWNSILVFAGDNHVYRHRVETLVIKDLSEIFLKFDEKGDYHIPAGSVEKDLPLDVQASNECNEEAHLKVRNVEYTGITYKRHVPVPKSVKPNANFGIHWNGNYNEVFIGEYDGKFTKKVDEEDRDPFILSGKFYPIKDVYGKLIPEHKKAIMNFMRMRNSDEFNEKAKFDNYYSCKVINLDENQGNTLSLEQYMRENVSDNFSSNLFFNSIEESVKNCNEKSIGSFLLISTPVDSVCGKIRSINSYNGEVVMTESLFTRPIRLVKMVDDNNYIDVSVNDNSNSPLIYFPLNNADEKLNGSEKRFYTRDYDKACSYAIFKSIRNNLKKLIFSNNPCDVFRWNNDTGRVECSPSLYDRIIKQLQNCVIHGNICGIKESDVKSKCVDDSIIISFIINPVVMKDFVSVLKNPLDASNNSVSRKYCIMDKLHNHKIRVSDNLTDLIREILHRSPKIDKSTLVTVLGSEFFDRDYFDNIMELDGYPVKKITKPLGSWCTQCKLDVPVQNEIMEESSDDTDYKVSIDLESTVILGFLNQNYRLFKELYDYLDDSFDDFKKSGNSNADASKRLRKIDNIISNIKKEIEDSYSVYTSSCKKVIKTYKEDKNANRFARMNFNSVYKKYQDLFKKYDKLMEKVDDEALLVPKLVSKKEDTEDRMKFNSLVYRVGDAYKLIGRIFLKIDEVMNPDTKENDDD